MKFAINHIKVDIVLPNYNSYPFIEETIKSDYLKPRINNRLWRMYIMKKYLLYFAIIHSMYASETGVLKLTDSAGTEQLNFLSGTALYLYIIDLKL